MGIMDHYFANQVASQLESIHRQFRSMETPKGIVSAASFISLPCSEERQLCLKVAEDGGSQDFVSLGVYDDLHKPVPRPFSMARSTFVQSDGIRFTFVGVR
jgi:hypothetical protein